LLEKVAFSSLTEEIMKPIVDIAFDLKDFYSIVLVPTFVRISIIIGIKTL
jgi:hypothetical protein